MGNDKKQREVEARFAKDVADHKMTILSENGVNRCIRFVESKGSFNMYFTITTWPQYLCISGDMGCFVFTRLHDMFEFFRSPSEKLTINPQYWAEKCDAQDRRTGGIDEYDAEELKSAIKYRFDEHEFSSKSAKTACWKEIERDILCAETEYEAHSFGHRFESNGFRLTNFWEHKLRSYTYHFLWCCYAIAWAIKQYDAPSASAENSKEENLGKSFSERVAENGQ